MMDFSGLFFLSWKVNPLQMTHPLPPPGGLSRAGRNSSDKEARPDSLWCGDSESSRRNHGNPTQVHESLTEATFCHLDSGSILFEALNKV